MALCTSKIALVIGFVAVALLGACLASLCSFSIKQRIVKDKWTFPNFIFTTYVALFSMIIALIVPFLYLIMQYFFKSSFEAVHSVLPCEGILMVFFMTSILSYFMVIYLFPRECYNILEGKNYFGGHAISGSFVFDKDLNFKLSEKIRTTNPLWQMNAFMFVLGYFLPYFFPVATTAPFSPAFYVLLFGIVSHAPFYIYKSLYLLRSFYGVRKVLKEKANYMTNDGIMKEFNSTYLEPFDRSFWRDVIAGNVWSACKQSMEWLGLISS